MANAKPSAVKNFWDIYEGFKNGDTRADGNIKEAERKVGELKKEYKRLEDEYRALLREDMDEEAMSKQGKMRVLEDKIRFAGQKLQNLKARYDEDVKTDVLRVGEAAAKAIEGNNKYLEDLQAKAQKKKEEYETILQELQGETGKFCSIRRAASRCMRSNNVRRESGVGSLPRVLRYSPKNLEVKVPKLMSDLPLE